jgi:asparagine synthase (glutamine-hydrolysing)
MWRGILKLPPGHLLAVDLGRDCPEPVRYWDYPSRPPREDLPDSQYDRQFADLFDDAVGIRLVADVPVGIMLSGGLDSSAVAAVAARRMATVKTFSVSFAGSPATDERAYARLVAGHIGAEHHEVVIGQREFVDYLPDFVWDTDEPLADLASIPLRYLSKLARKHVTVVLSGEGSDEMLGGYDLDLWMDIWEREKTDYRFREAPNMTNYLDGAQKAALMGCSYPDSLEPLAGEIRSLGPRHPLEQMLRALCRDWLVEDLLMKADKMSMACSLELRTPFLDYRLAEWAWRAPVRVKVGRDETGKYATKRVLRRFAKDLLPEEILSRPKQGFPVPVYDWLPVRLSGLARELLEGQDSWLRRMFKPQAVAAMLAGGLAPEAPVLDRHRLWNLMILELWGRRWGVS